MPQMLHRIYYAKPCHEWLIASYRFLTAPSRQQQPGDCQEEHQLLYELREGFLHRSCGQGRQDTWASDVLSYQLGIIMDHHGSSWITWGLPHVTLIFRSRPSLTEGMCPQHLRPWWCYQHRRSELGMKGFVGTQSRSSCQRGCSNMLS